MKAVHAAPSDAPSPVEINGKGDREDSFCSPHILLQGKCAVSGSVSSSSPPLFFSCVDAHQVLISRCLSTIRSSRCCLRR